MAREFADYAARVVRDQFVSKKDLYRLIHGLDEAIQRSEEYLADGAFGPSGGSWVELIARSRLHRLRLRYSVGIELDELAEEMAAIARSSVENNDDYTRGATADDFGPLLRLFGVHDLLPQFGASSAHRAYTRLVDRVLGADRAADARNYGPPLNDGGRSARRMELVDRLITDPDDSEPLAAYVDDWYGLCRDEPWWASGSQVNGLYAGYWCFEAAALAVAVGTDDAAVVEHPHYPSDLAEFARANAR